MHRHKARWQQQASLLLDSEQLDLDQVAQLLQDIIRRSESPALLDLANQAFAAVRAASRPQAGVVSRSIARQRRQSLSQDLNSKPTMTFGRRSGAQSSLRPKAKPEQAEHGHRELLGLPRTGPLFEPDIRAAYRRATRWAHPDSGGDLASFHRLVQARDSLLAACHGS